MFEIILTERARKHWDSLKTDPGLKKRFRAVRKTFLFLSENPRHPGLTHEFTSLKGPQGEKVFEAYAEQSTPAAYRVFWYYGPEEHRIFLRYTRFQMVFLSIS